MQRVEILAALQKYPDCDQGGIGTGHAGVAQAFHYVIRVPSVVIPEEFNILLNPTHADYCSVQWTVRRPFRSDPRLFVAEPRIL